MNTPDQGLSALEAIVSQATQQLFKEYPWLAAAYGEQMNRGGVLPEGKALETVLAKRFDQFSERAVEQLTMHMSGDLGDGDNSTLSGTVPSTPHLQTAAISITHQGGVL